MSDATPLLALIPASPTDATFLDELAEHLRDARRWAELLEVRLMQARLAAGLAVDAASIADAPAEQRQQAETAYTNACREAGLGMLADAPTGHGSWRQAWFYLKAADHPQPLQDALRALPSNHASHPDADEEQIEELIEVALHEGADPALGYRWLIERYGTCNAVTQLEGLGPHLAIHALASCAAVLVEHLHAELTSVLRELITSEEGTPPAPEATLPELLAGRDWLFANEASHVDASHLSAGVRMARVLEEPTNVRAALDLAEYGIRLHPTLHYADAPPFDEVYLSHQLFYAAQLGEQVDDAVDYFRKRADQAVLEIDGLAPLETLLVLLTRIGRGGEALKEFHRLAPADAQLSPYAPRLIDMARRSGDWQTFDEVMRARGNVIALAQGRLARMGC